jgi:hypothetical protein
VSTEGIPTCSRGEECRQLRRKLRRLEGAAAAGAQQRHRSRRRRLQRTPQRLLQGGPGWCPDPCEGAGRLPCSSRAGHTSRHLKTLLKAALPVAGGISI